MTLAEAIRGARLSVGLTLAQLAERIGLQPDPRGGCSALSRLEAGRHAPTHATLANVARATGQKIVVTYRPDGAIEAEHGIGS